MNPDWKSFQFSTGPLTQVMKKHEQKMEPNTIEDQIRQILIDELPVPDLAIRCFNVSIAANIQGDEHLWFKQWCFTLDAILAFPAKYSNPW